jgi:hypothetical protein
MAAGAVTIMRAHRNVTKELSMTKTLNLIQDTVHNTKHPFRQAENRPAKAQKNRYERRKIREFLRLGDWTDQQEA